MTLTTIEKECEQVLTMVSELWTKPHKVVGRMEFMEILGHVRDALIKLRNKEFGCATGCHAGLCNCKEGEKGKNIYGIHRPPRHAGGRR
jgi:hypothetical protein